MESLTHHLQTFIADHVAKVSRGLGEAMRGLEASAYGEHLADRGW